MPLPLPPASQPLILAVSSVLLPLHHKITARLPTYCLKTITNADKYEFIPCHGLRDNRRFCYSEKNQNRTIFCYIMQNFRLCTMVKEALTPLDRASSMKMYKNSTRSRFFCRIAKRSIKKALMKPFVTFSLLCDKNTLAAVTLGGLSRCFLSKQRKYNAVVCDRSSCSHTTLLQRYVLGARVFKKP